MMRIKAYINDDYVGQFHFTKDEFPLPEFIQHNDRFYKLQFNENLLEFEYREIKRPVYKGKKM